MILPIKFFMYWELIRHKNQKQINKNNIRENSKIVDQDYKFRDKVMIVNNYA